METVTIQQNAVEDYKTLEFWEPHFHDNCVISLQYYTVDDGVKLLGVFAENTEFPDRTPVMMIPGWFSLIDGWTEVTKYISKYRSIFYFETREKGSSIIPDDVKNMSVERMAEDLKQVRHLMPFDLEQCILLASSMGGTVMLSYLGDQEPAPRTSILIGPNAEFKVPPIITKAATYLPLLVVNFLKKIIKWWVVTFRVDTDKEPEQGKKYTRVINEVEPWKLKHSARDCIDYEAWDILSDIDADVILVGASADKMHKAEETRQLINAIKDSSFVDFPSNRSTHSTEMGEFVEALISDDHIPK